MAAFFVTRICQWRRRSAFDHADSATDATWRNTAKTVWRNTTDATDYATGCDTQSSDAIVAKPTGAVGATASADNYVVAPSSSLATPLLRLRR